MQEIVLKCWFSGQCTSADLQADMQDGEVRHGWLQPHHFEDMDGRFEVETAHMLALCDALEAGQLSADHLREIGYCLIASEHFFWDEDSASGGRVGAVAVDWSSPEDSRPLDADGLGWYRRFLVGDSPD